MREASTAFLATKVSFINELSSLCERINADAVDFSFALGLDKRIAPRSLQPGSLGGSFTESDMDSLANLAAGSGVSLKILTAAREVNHEFCARIMKKISAPWEQLMASKSDCLVGFQAQYELRGQLGLHPAGAQPHGKRRAREGL